MELNDYQNKAMATCLPTSKNFSYMMLNLVGEVGEFASKVAKGIRQGVAEIQENNDFAWIGDVSSKSAWDKSVEDNELRDKELMKEAGDILWQLSGLCYIMDWKLQDIADIYLEKLASRRKKNVINDNEDNR